MLKQELEVNLETCRFRERLVGEKRTRERRNGGSISERHGETFLQYRAVSASKSPGTSRRIFMLLALNEGFSC